MHQTVARAPWVGRCAATSLLCRFATGYNHPRVEGHNWDRDDDIVVVVVDDDDDDDDDYRV